MIMYEKINPMQALVDAMSEQWRKERAATQMTLGELIGALERLPSETLVQGLTHAHSYRGYYSDLAFEPQGTSVSAGDLLAQCRAAMGRVFEGYKGGDYVMGETTPIWIADYGTTCGARKILDLNADGTFATREDE
jgi:hypothetical protein